MTTRVVTVEPTWDGFREIARRLIQEGAEPDSVRWVEAGDASTHQLGLLEPEPARARRSSGAVSMKVPKDLVELGEAVACHREPFAWPWLYRVLWRVVRGERNLLRDPADPDMVVLGGMERAVRRDSHKMKAFVRFRSVIDPEGERFVAWFEPKHRIVRRTAPFFERRFPSMRWSILTPDECAHWDRETLTFTPGLTRDAAPDEDAMEEAWLTYYTHTFNPARVRVQAMRAEMPVYYWRNMPEASAIEGLLRDAPARVRKMIANAPPPRVKAPGRIDSGERIDHRDLSVAVSPAARRASSLPALTLTSEAPVAPRSRAAGKEPPPDLAPIRVPKIRIGVAGWDYPDWADRVYPAGRDGVDRLRWVAARFDLIEVNSTFYRPASRRASTSWLERTRDRPHLQFAAKLVRSFTHERGAWRLSDVAAVHEGMLPLLEAGKLTSLLIQFPWSFKLGYDERRHLKRVIDAFADFPLHIEVRHTSWNHAGFRDYLTGRGVGLVNIDQPIFEHSIEPAAEVTNPIAYVRLHGRNSEAWFRADATRDERYDYSYGTGELRPWVERAGQLASREDVKEVEVVFNNHYRGQAVDNAEAFGRLLASFPD